MTEALPPEAAPWADLSQTLGRDLLLTQASGGNTSVKLDDRRFLVKASGFRLGEVSAEKGWVVADYQAIRRGVPEIGRRGATAQAQADAYQSLLASSNLTRGPKISLEAGLHALLPDRWVAHVHSVSGQLLGLMPEDEARAITERTLGNQMELHTISPAVPGHELCGKVAERLDPGDRPAEGRDIKLWILKNHGLAWGGATDRVVRAASAAFEGPLRERFGLHRYPPPLVELINPRPHAPEGKTWYRLSLPDWPACDFDSTPVLTDFVGHFDLWSGAPPDFIKADDRTAHILAKSPREIEGHGQVFFAHALVSTIARREGWFRPLPPDAVQAIKLLLLERPSEGY